MLYQGTIIRYRKSLDKGGADGKLDVLSPGLESDVFDGGAAQGRRPVFHEGMTIRKVAAGLGYPSEGAPAERVRGEPRHTGACGRSYTPERRTDAAGRALGGEPPARVACDAGCTPRGRVPVDAPPP